MLKIIVLGEPVTQLRPIMSTKGTRKVTAIDPPKSRKYKELVKATALKYIGVDWELLDQPLSVDIKFYMGVTKSWSKKKKEMALSGEVVPTHLKDLDNLAKSVLDSFSDTVWKDDGCIVDMTLSKRYDKVPRMEIVVSTIEDKISSNRI